MSKNRITEALAGAHTKNEEFLTEKQKAILPSALNLSKRLFVKFAAMARRSAYYDYDAEEQEGSDSLISSIPHLELIGHYRLFEGQVLKYFQKYYAKKDCRRSKLRNLSRAAAALRMVDELRDQADKRNITIKSKLFK